jgi:hypothetical protein
MHCILNKCIIYLYYTCIRQRLERLVKQIDQKLVSGINMPETLVGNHQTHRQAPVHLEEARAPG